MSKRIPPDVVRAASTIIDALVALDAQLSDRAHTGDVAMYGHLQLRTDGDPIAAVRWDEDYGQWVLEAL